jgi:hypothetical protein
MRKKFRDKLALWYRRRADDRQNMERPVWEGRIDYARCAHIARGRIRLCAGWVVQPFWNLRRQVRPPTPYRPTSLTVVTDHR